MSRGGFHGRQLRAGGFDKPPQPGAGDTLDHVLYPPNRPFYYVAPAIIAATPLALGPRVPSTALHLCQHLHPCPAHEVLVQSEQSVLWYYETSTRGKRPVASVGEICKVMDQVSETKPSLALDNDDILKRLRGEVGDPMFGTFVGRLPPELRIFAPSRAASSAPEMRVLQKIKQHRRRRLEKPQRRGGVVLPSSTSTAGGSKDALLPSSKGRSSASFLSKKVKQRPSSQFVDDAAREDDGAEDEAARKRLRDVDEGDSGSDGADEEGETSASCGGDNDDDDDAVDDASGGGSGDELTF